MIILTPSKTQVLQALQHNLWDIKLFLSLRICLESVCKNVEVSSQN